MTEVAVRRSMAETGIFGRGDFGGVKWGFRESSEGAGG